MVLIEYKDSGFSNMIQNYKNFGSDVKMLAKRPKGDPNKTGDYTSLHEWLLNEVKNAKKLDRLDYLAKDAHVSITTLEKLAKNMEDVQKGYPNRYVNVKYINSLIKGGNSPKKIKDHIKWIKGPYLSAIKKRKIELRKANKESALYIDEDMFK